MVNYPDNLANLSAQFYIARIDFCINYALILFPLIYVVILLPWIVIAGCQLFQNIKNKLRLKKVSVIDPSERIYLLYEFYKETVVRNLLFAIFLAFEFGYFLFYIIFDISHLNSMKYLDFVCQSNSSNNYLGGIPIFRFVVCLTNSCLLMMFLMFWLVLQHLSMSVSRKYSFRKLYINFFLCILVSLSVMVFYFIPSSLDFLLTIYDFFLRQFIIIILIKKGKHFLQLIRWERDDLRSYYTQSSPLIKERNWLIHKYKITIYGHVVAFQLFITGIIIEYIGDKLYHIFVLQCYESFVSRFNLNAISQSNLEIIAVLFNFIYLSGHVFVIVFYIVAIVINISISVAVFKRKRMIGTKWSYKPSDFPPNLIKPLI